VVDVTSSAQQASGGPRVAFLLAQIGAQAGARFAERTREIGLTPSDAGVLRILGRSPGISQRALADRLSAVPSRVVALIDSLESRSLVERVRSDSDRRNYQLRLTDQGAAILRDLREIGQAHEAELTADLTDRQAAQLETLLRRIATAQGLEPDVHPGYRGQPRGRARPVDGVETAGRAPNP